MPLHPFQSNCRVAVLPLRTDACLVPVEEMPLKTNDHVDHDAEAKPRPFPSTSTFFGIAAAMIALWLLASGLGQLFGPAGQPNAADAGRSVVAPADQR